MTEFVTSRDGTRIAYDRYGNGPAIIFVAGATAHRATDPEVAKLGELLKDRFTLINYDRRGRGESTDTAPYAKDRELEDMKAIIDANGGHAFVYAISSGAVLAIEAAAAGLSIDRIVAHEPPVKDYPAGYVERLDAAIAAGDRDKVAEIFMRDAVGLPDEMIAGTRHSPYWAMMTSVAPTIAYDGRFVTDANDFATRWTSITTPILVTDGTASFPFFPPICDAIAKALPNASRRSLEGQGHGPSAEAIAPVLIEFFER